MNIGSVRRCARLLCITTKIAVEYADVTFTVLYTHPAPKKGIKKINIYEILYTNITENVHHYFVRTVVFAQHISPIKLKHKTEHFKALRVGEELKMSLARCAIWCKHSIK